MIKSEKAGNGFTGRLKPLHLKGSSSFRPYSVPTCIFTSTYECYTMCTQGHPMQYHHRVIACCSPINAHNALDAQCFILMELKGVIGNE